MMEMLPLLQEVYPSLTNAQYAAELDQMIPHNYGQVAAFDGDNCLGVTGFWIGTKLWCGKYMELDNVVVSAVQRSKGVGDLLFDYMRNKAQELNCTMLALDSYTDNFKAHKFFYKKQYIPRGFHFIHVLQADKIR